MKNTDKIKRILALTVAILLLLLYLSTLIFALIGSSRAIDLLKVAVAATIFFPVIIYGVMLLYKIL